MVALMRTARTIVRRGLKAGVLAPLNDGVAIDRLLQRVNRRWSIRDVRAKVVSVTPEAGNACSIWLAPNRLWRGHVAGQHVVIGVEIDGVTHHRAFSLSSVPRKDRLLRLTLRVSARALVSRWLQDPARVGDVVTISQAQGDFTLPTVRPDRLMMIAGGSGISPLMAMLQQLATEQCRGDITLLRVDRLASDVLLEHEVSELQHQLPGLRVVQHLSSLDGRFDTERFHALVPDAATRCGLMCGPEGLMTLVRSTRDPEGLPLLQEHFAAPSLRTADELDGAPCRIVVQGAPQPFEAQPGQSLLIAAERAGLKPKSGCRAGICRSCLCQKRRGSTRNLITGARSDLPDEWIQLCISTAESDLELSL